MFVNPGNDGRNRGGRIEAQIIGTIRKAEASFQLRGKHGFPDSSFCGWRARLGSMAETITAVRR